MLNYITTLKYIFFSLFTVQYRTTHVQNKTSPLPLCFLFFCSLSSQPHLNLNPSSTFFHLSSTSSLLYPVLQHSTRKQYTVSTIIVTVHLLLPSVCVLFCVCYCYCQSHYYCQLHSTTTQYQKTVYLLFLSLSLLLSQLQLLSMFLCLLLSQYPLLFLCVFLLLSLLFTVTIPVIVSYK